MTVIIEHNERLEIAPSAPSLPTRPRQPLSFILAISPGADLRVLSNRLIIRPHSVSVFDIICGFPVLVFLLIYSFKPFKPLPFKISDIIFLITKSVFLFSDCSHCALTEFLTQKLYRTVMTCCSKGTEFRRTHTIESLSDLVAILYCLFSNLFLCNAWLSLVLPKHQKDAGSTPSQNQPGLWV